MPRGGRLTISTESAQLLESSARVNPKAYPGRFVCLRVADTGCGMDQPVLSRIFEPFFTTKEIGQRSGLGLATVYGIVEQHKGWIDVNSQVGAGTTFKIFLPASPSPSAEERGSPTLDRELDGHETILLVEDEASVRKLMARVLERHGYQVIEAGDGSEAVQIWEANHGRIDLLLTDMVMPNGISGRDLAARLLSLKPKLKVLMTSGHSPDAASSHFQEGFNFIQKPYAPEKLVGLVRGLLDAA